MKHTKVGAFAAAGAACVLIAGCGARPWMNNAQSAAPLMSQTGPEPAAASAPYALSAQCNGPMVRFQLQNRGDTDLQVEEKDFALVVPGEGRKVIPYAAESVSVDLPSKVVAPRETLEGRAVFNDKSMPQGCRLVFKPYSRPGDQGTYALIQSPSNGTI